MFEDAILAQVQQSHWRGSSTYVGSLPSVPLSQRDFEKGVGTWNLFLMGMED